MSTNYSAVAKTITDSLQYVVKNTSDKNIKLKLLLELGDAYADRQELDSAFTIAKRAELLASNLDNKLDYYQAIGLKGKCKLLSGEFAAAITIYTNLIEIAKQSKDAKLKKRLATYYNRLAAAHYYNGNYLNALDNYFKTTNVAERAHDGGMLFSGNNGMANVYFQQKKHDLAIRFYKKAMSYIKNDKYNKASIYQNLATCYRELNTRDSSVFYYQKAIVLFKDLNIQSDVAVNLYSLSTLLIEQNNYVLAEEYLKESYGILKKIGNTYDLTKCVLNLATLEGYKKNKKSSFQYANEALALAKQQDSKELLKETYRVLAEVNNTFGNYKQAYDYRVLYNNISDTLSNKEMTNAIAEMQTKYETEKKEQEITQLNLKTEAQTIRIEKQNTQRNLLLVLILAIAAIGIVFYKQYQLKKESNKLLQEKNEAIEQQRLEIQEQKAIVDIQHKEIKDSINYAHHIQTSIQPTIELSSVFADSFIIYKPKSVVSGDFYWFEQKDDLFYIAAADCTGHGVPGAFMSMLGTTLLNEIFNKHTFVTPADILTKLNYLLKITFKQHIKNFTVQDGMDISICIIDKKNNTIQYAGAQRPLWIINTKSELKELVPDKQAIGGLTALDYTFTNHQQVLQQGDSIYLFTDGYADQFGGYTNKKMLIKRFREKLFAIQSMSMQQQQHELENYFNSWQGTNEQIDDVLVCGIKI